MTTVSASDAPLTGAQRISIHDQEGIDELGKRLRIDRHLIRRFRNAYYKKQQLAKDALRIIPKEARDRFQSSVQFHNLELIERRDSRIDGATKLRFRTSGGAELETVILRIDSGRTSVCVSSQVGCAAKCEFCATGQMKRVVSLQAAEILDQVIRANQLLGAEGRWVRNVVFMGMGEPLHNEARVIEAIEALRDPSRFNLSERHIVVSTVGIPDAMIRLARQFPRVHQALSLHSVHPELRQRLMPIAKKVSLQTLRETVREVSSIQGTTVMIEYLLLEGWNASLEDAEALSQYLNGLAVHVNVIPFNEVPGSAFRTPVKEERERFAQFLRDEGFAVTLRYSLGADIAAACGQLVKEEESRIKSSRSDSPGTW